MSKRRKPAPVIDLADYRRSRAVDRGRRYAKWLADYRGWNALDDVLLFFEYCQNRGRRAATQ